MPFVSPVPDRVAQQRVSREVTAERLVIRRRWGTPLVGVLVIVAALLLGFVAIKGDDMLAGQLPGPEWLHRVLLVPVAIAMAYGGVCVMFNSTEMEVTRELLRVSKGPVPCGREVRLDPSGIRGISYREHVETGYATKYDLVAVTGEGEFILLGALDNYEVLVFYVRELREFLRLPNRSMASLI